MSSSSQQRSESDGDPPERVGAWWGSPLAETRWLLELGRLLADPLFSDPVGIPRGDGRPVVMVPGFMAGDQTLAVLGTWLRRVGYAPHTCGFVSNLDCSERVLQRVQRTVGALTRSHGHRVAVIGHSRGGHLARALGARCPEDVSHAISLGADLRAMLGVSVPTLGAVAATRTVLRAAGRTLEPQCLTRECPCPFGADYSRAFPADRVRLTSIYTKSDGVVRWEGCIVPEADCVEVRGTHVGLIFNRDAYRAVAAALAVGELPVAKTTAPREVA